MSTDTSEEQGGNRKLEDQATTVEQAYKPRKVVVATTDKQMLSVQNIHGIRNYFYKRLFEHMSSEQPEYAPKFNNCYRFDPFGVLIECDNEDAYKWVVNETQYIPLANNSKFTFTDEDDLPKYVNMYVDTTYEPVIKHGPTFLFEVLKNTNRLNYETSSWIFRQKLPTPPQTFTRIEFCVPVGDLTKLREGGFKLYYLLGTVTVVPLVNKPIQGVKGSLDYNDGILASGVG